jgi:hypothetical protein
MPIEIHIAELAVPTLLTKKDSFPLPLFVREKNLTRYWRAGCIGRCAIVKADNTGIVHEKE